MEKQSWLSRGRTGGDFGMRNSIFTVPTHYHKNHYCDNKMLDNEIEIDYTLIIAIMIITKIKQRRYRNEQELSARHCRFRRHGRHRRRRPR
jgi:hypothetical protein